MPKIIDKRNENETKQTNKKPHHYLNTRSATVEKFNNTCVLRGWEAGLLTHG